MKSTKPGVQLIPLALLGVALASASHAAETPAQKHERQLLERLAKSDAQTAILQRRIDALEQRIQELRANIEDNEKAQLRPAVAQAPAPSPAPSKPASNAPKPAASSAPGKFEVDEEAAQRALERTLTQAGALLLNAGTYELTPSFTYKRNEFTTPALLSTTNQATGASDLLLGNQRIRRNEMTAELGFRAGLPYQAQFEASLPYNYTRSSQLTDLSPSNVKENANGMGDVTIGIAKTLLRESGWRPDLIGRVSYNFGNGKRREGTVDLGGGFRQLQGEFVAIKRQDPLAFVASAFYAKSFEDDGIKPGNAMGFSLSALLAASPATSLQFGFSQIYRQEQELNGVTVNGSDQTYGIATIGASSVLSRDTTLITRIGIGLGNDAPKYSISVALPILIR
jgi:hypothetical protein